MRDQRTVAIWIVSMLLAISLVTVLYGHHPTEGITITGDLDAAAIDGPGGRAWDYLQDDVYTMLEIEVDGSKEAIPFEQHPFDELNETIELFCDKDYHGYVWDLDEPDERETYGLHDLREVAADLRDRENRGAVCTLHIIFLPGRAVDTSIAAYTIDASTIIVFSEYVRPTLLGTVLAHEFGHVLGAVGILGSGSGYYPDGLVDHQTGTDHCGNFGCYMNEYASLDGYWCEDCERDILYLKGTECPYTITKGSTFERAVAVLAFPGLAIISSAVILAMVGINLAWTKRPKIK